MLAATWIPPLPGPAPAGGRRPAAPLAHVVTVVAGRRGAVAADAVASALAATGWLDRCAWVRGDEVLRDPGLLTHALVRAVRRRRPDAAAALAERLGHSGPARTARSFAEALAGGDPLAVVVEDVGRRSSSLVPALVEAWSATNTTRSPLVAVFHGRPPRALRARAEPPPRPGTTPASRRPLGRAAQERLGRITPGYPAVAADVLAAAEAWEGTDLAGAVAGARNLRGLLTAVTDRLVDEAPLATLATLVTAVRLGCWHPRLGDDEFGDAARSDLGRLQPWLIPLEDGWHAVRPVWSEALARAVDRALRRGRSPRLRPPRAGLPSSGPVGGAPRASGDAGGRGCVLRVRLLGDFELAVDGRTVTDWNGQLGQALVKYLLAQPKRACGRDVLLERFWPGVHPDVARKRLHVALSGVRRALAAVTDAALVEFHDGAYRIAPVHEVDTDVDRFHALVEAGRGAEIDDRPDDAAALYRRAAAAYSGELLADSPYDEWTMLPRETLRMTYLDLLDRWTGLLAAAGRDAECIEVGQLVLRQDPCREDVHRLVMRCHAHLGGTAQALRQYEVCRRALHETMGVEPSSPTRALARSLRDPA